MTHRFCQFQVGGSEAAGGGFASGKQGPEEVNGGGGFCAVFQWVSDGFPTDFRSVCFCGCLGVMKL